MKNLTKLLTGISVLAIFNTALAVEINTSENEITKDGIKYKITTGIDYSEGDYGQDQDTKITYVPFTFKATKDNFSAKITVPWLQIEGPGAVVGAGGSGVVNNLSGTVTTESGLGDIVFAGSYTYDIADTTYVDFTGKVKLPTADDDKGLGTGKTDYTIAIDATHQIHNTSISAGGGHRFVGSSATLNLDDVWFASVGLGQKINDKFSIGVSYDYSQAAGTGDDPSEATLYGSYKITDQVNLQPYVLKGFSDGSADLGGGIMVSYKFN